MVNIKSAIQYTIGPAIVKYLLPYLPDSLPLIGAINESVTEYGKINIPVTNALYFRISCKKKGNKILFVYIAI